MAEVDWKELEMEIFEHMVLVLDLVLCRNPYHSSNNSENYH